MATRGAREAHRKEIAALAAANYEGHTIQKLPDGRWRCAQKGASAYHYYVAFFPGTVIIYGDIGELILRHSDADSQGWAIEAVNSIDYVLGKAPESMRELECVDGMVAEALRWWRERIGDEDTAADRTKEREKLRELIDKIREREVCNRDTFNAAYYDLTGDFEPPEVGDWSVTAQYCFHALRWLVKAKGEGIRA